MQNSTEKAVIWTQPEKNRYRYEQPRHQAHADKVSHDRYIAVDVIIRAPEGERALIELSDTFIAACETVFGAQPYGWRFDGDSDGAGSSPNDACWQEFMSILIRCDVVLTHYAASAPISIVVQNEISNPLGTAESGIFVEGPAKGENAEVHS